MGYHPLSPKDEDELTDEEFVVQGKRIQTHRKVVFGTEKSEINVDRGFKRRKKNEKSFEEITLIVEKVMSELVEVVAEDDAQLNREGQPAIRKLQKLPFLREVLCKKRFQLHFLDRGILTLLKNWLEPLPDGSLPNATVRGAILDILTDFPLDFETYQHREQFKKSGLGRVVMFLSQSDEELSSNKRVAKGLLDKWSRIIFDKSDRFTDLRNRDDNDIIVPMIRKPVAVSKPAKVEYEEGILYFNVAKERKPSFQSSSRSNVLRGRNQLRWLMWCAPHLNTTQRWSRLMLDNKCMERPAKGYKRG